MSRCIYTCMKSAMLECFVNECFVNLCDMGIC